MEQKDEKECIRKLKWRSVASIVNVSVEFRRSLQLYGNVRLIGLVVRDVRDKVNAYEIIWRRWLWRWINYGTREHGKEIKK